MINYYVSPIDHSPLINKNGFLEDSSGNIFEVINGVPNFVYPKELSKSDLDSLEWYKNNAAFYDEFLPLTFDTFGVDEDKEREKLVKNLHLNSDHKVLEIGCGTGRDSEKILNYLGAEGELYLQDISPEILKIAVDKFSNKKFDANVFFSLSNAYYLPFPDHYFDRVFHFGGLNTFGDLPKTFSEIIRVTKPGGRVVVGDENMPIWLRETEFGKVLMNSNPHYRYHLPLEHLPIEARNVSLEWFIGGVFYMISFDVGTGEPYANLDFEIPGIRGGTHRTRFYGHLEGVKPETVQIAKRAREKSGKSMHQWLDDAIQAAASQDLED